MTDGVGWAAAEIVWFLVAATLVGLAIGWVLGRWLEGRSAAERYEGELAAQQELARKAEHRLTESDKLIGKLQSELKDRNSGMSGASTPSEAPGESAHPGEASEADDVVESAEEPSKAEGLAVMAEIAARTAGGEPITDDDLKKVHGIGPKLEKTLKGLGITSFRQIANFSEEDVANVTAALDAFRGRIERDDWMSSAAQLHLEKYNSPV